MPKAIVLGAGLVGSVIAADLAEDDRFQVAVADRRREALERVRDRTVRARTGSIQLIEADLADPATVQATVAPYDIVLGALASGLGFQTLRAVIEAGKDYCDISFMPEDAWTLDDLARERQVTAVVDCGVAPGMSNMLVGDAYRQLDQCERIEIYVGGLPVERRWPFQYKAAFSPADVIEEYTRPARIVENGQIVIREPLSEPELLYFRSLGSLEAFNTDGLRSLTVTLRAPFMKEKTLRYPGHRELMQIFSESGLFSLDPIEVDGDRVRPRDVFSALVFPAWTYGPDEADLTVMRVIVEGVQNGQAVRHQWDLLDRSEPAGGPSSMARTTAYPCAIVARLIATGRYRRPGVSPPELLGQESGMLETVLQELESRNVRFNKS